jgi:hypothetical protein
MGGGREVGKDKSGAKREGEGGKRKEVSVE